MMPMRPTATSTSSISTRWRDRPSVIVSNIIYAGRAWNLSDEEVVARTIAELVGTAGGQARARFRRIHRIPMAIPCPFVGAERLRLDSATPIDHLVLAGDWLRTGLPPSMESACFSGWRAAEVVLAAIGRPTSLVQRPVELDPLASLLGRAAAFGTAFLTPV